MATSRRAFTMESLEPRRMMHADVSLSNKGLLSIEADPEGGTVQVMDCFGRLPSRGIDISGSCHTPTDNLHTNDELPMANFERPSTPKSHGTCADNTLLQ